MRRLSFLLTLLVLTGVVRGQAPVDPASRDAFANAVDVDTLGQIAVHVEGRLKSFDSFAREMMQVVSGSRQYRDRAHVFTYLDLAINPQHYRDADIIYVKKKPIREKIADALRSSTNPAVLDRLDDFMSHGMISETMLFQPEAAAAMESMSADLIRTAKPVREIQSALTVKQADFLLARWSIIPPTSGPETASWASVMELLQAPGEVSPRLSAMDQGQLQTLTDSWRDLVTGWIADDAAAVNDAAARMAGVLLAIAPDRYPDQSRLAWESWYFKSGNMTWIWLVYLVSLIPLLVSVIYRWNLARWIGLLLFLLAFGLHTFAFFLRWYVSERFPNSNMFEAVTTSVWFGGCAAVFMEVLVRKTPMRNFFALGSAVASMTGMMAVHFLPLYLDANISNRMPVLHDVWLYIHTNVIIFSYALIFIATIPAIGYLLYRLIGKFRGFGGPEDWARVGGAGSLIITTPDGSTVISSNKSTLGQVLDGVTMVILEMAFIMLWAGLVMGAIWADHSWGRPWGWDPKETFALNTFIIFAILVHLRFRSADKGMWTAILALVGAVVMLFNWIVINFVITGLHSYA